jgi:hydroxypyruvate isomerase
VQIADNPGRNEPGTGEINYRIRLRRTSNGIGYDGYVGAEYKPKAGTVEGLGWFKEASVKRDAA